MTEVQETEAPKEPENYSPQEVHKGWLERVSKSGIAKDRAVVSIAMYGMTTVSAYAAGSNFEKIGGVVSTLRNIASYAEQVGGRISLETVKQVSELASVDEKTALWTLAVVGTSFVAGTVIGLGALESAKQES